jgi:GxxExxY protein
MEVHRHLGRGFLEGVYKKALAHELTIRGIPYFKEVPLDVNYKGIIAGKYSADFIVDNKIVLEIKATSALVPGHEAQAINYLAATGLRLALLLNFGSGSLQIKRIIL